MLLGLELNNRSLGISALQSSLGQLNKRTLKQPSFNSGIITDKALKWKKTKKRFAMTCIRTFIDTKTYQNKPLERSLRILQPFFHVPWMTSYQEILLKKRYLPWSFLWWREKYQSMTKSQLNFPNNYGQL